jgi:hypothetical protein
MTDTSDEELINFCQIVTERSNSKSELKCVTSTQERTDKTLAELTKYEAGNTTKKNSILAGYGELNITRTNDNEQNFSRKVPENPIQDIFKCLPRIDVKKSTNTLLKVEDLSKVTRPQPTKNQGQQSMIKHKNSGLWADLESTDSVSESTLKTTEEKSKSTENIPPKLSQKANKTISYEGVKCPKCPKTFSGSSNTKLKDRLRCHVGGVHYGNELRTEVKSYFKGNQCQKCNYLPTDKNTNTKKMKHLFFSHTKYVEIVMNETMKALEEKSMARDVSRGPTNSPDKVTIAPNSKIRSPSKIVFKSDEEELFAKVEDLLKSDDEDANKAVNEDARDTDIVKDTVDKASDVNDRHSDILDMQKRLAMLNGKELFDSEDISDDEELTESLDLEQMDDENLTEMINSELNELNDSIEGILDTDKNGLEFINKRKQIKESTEFSDETIKPVEVIPSIQEQLLLMQDFSDDDEDEEDEDRMQEFEDEEMPGEKSSDTARDGKNVIDNEEDQLEDRLDDILNMELPEEDISDNEHDGKWEEISEDMESSVHTNISDEEL